MKIYFLSSKPCALTLNGVFFGVTDDFERSAEVALSDRVYAKFSPEGALPIGFFITEELTRTPPVGCEVYVLRDGIAVRARDFPPVDFTLRPIAQKREGNTLVTLFQQGNLQLSVTCDGVLFAATLPPCFADAEILFHNGAILLKGKSALGVYSKECKPLLTEKVTDFALTAEGISATLPLSDCRGRTASCAWSLTEKECTLTSFTLRGSASSSDGREGLLAYAFFESALIGADCSPFLSDELQDEKERILRFLGDFVAVTLTNEPTVCGLLRKKGERLFVADYYSVTVRDGKIIDVQG